MSAYMNKCPNMQFSGEFYVLANRIEIKSVNLCQTNLRLTPLVVYTAAHAEIQSHKLPCLTKSKHPDRRNPHHSFRSRCRFWRRACSPQHRENVRVPGDQRIKIGIHVHQRSVHQQRSNPKVHRTEAKFELQTGKAQA